MSIGLIVERASSPISIEDWRGLVKGDDFLRIRSEPYVALNSGTGAVIRIPIGEADSEIRCEGEWLPFLRFKRGALHTEFQDNFEDPENPLRKKIAEVARQLGAVVATDIDDDPLDW